MRTHFTMIAFLILNGAWAQTKISGTVTDIAGKPLPLANIVLSGTYDGATCDADGRFEFVTDEPGSHQLTVRHYSYNEVFKQVNLDGHDLVIDVALEEAFRQLDAVTISAGAFTAGDDSRRTIFKALDIVTVAGATADVAGALNTLPGTQKVGESGRLFVRGGDSNEAKTFVDGMLVLDAYGAAAPNTPSRGRFLPFMFKGTSFSTGGYSAEYGQALSSALVLDSKDEDKTTRTDIGLLSVGADVSHTQAWDRGSAAAKIGFTDIRPYFDFINQRIDWQRAPVSQEGSGVFRQRIGESGLLKFYGNLNHTSFALYNHDIDDYRKSDLLDLTNHYAYGNVSYKTALDDNWMLRTGLSYTRIRNLTNTQNVRSDETESGIHSKISFEGTLTERIELKTGAEVLSRGYRNWIDGDTLQSSQMNFSESISSMFVESDISVSNSVVARVGVRGEYNDLQRLFSIDPRISFAYKTGLYSQISFAYGTFRQSVKNQYLRVNTSLDPETASHYILNYQILQNKRTFRAELFYKRYDNLVKFMNGNATYLNNKGSGDAKGIELFWRDNESLNNVDYWISYSYLDTERDYLNFPYAAIPTFASSHNFSVVYKHFVRPLHSQVGATYSFASGRPYNDPNTDRFNGGKTAAYHDLSVNWSYLPRPWLIIHLSCTNILGIDNVFGYEYSSNRNVDGIFNRRPVRQAASRFLFLGVFITLSKEKSVNQLPSL